MEIFMNIHMRFPGGRVRALTFSYDDGVRQDKKLIEIFNKNGLKGTFNINSCLYGKPEEADSGKGRMTLDECKAVYGSHEVACHSATHPFLEQLPVAKATIEVITDRENLERDFGGIVRGMAYPMGTFNDRLVDALKACGIVYCRTTKASGNFAMPEDWLRLIPTCHHSSPKIFELTEKFLSEANERVPRLFYIWGHSYEFDNNDGYNSWEHIEKLCEMLGGRDNVWYATNIEIYDYVKAYESLVWSANGKRVYNPTVTEVFFRLSGNRDISVKPGETVEL